MFIIYVLYLFSITALHIAVGSNKVDCVQTLVNCGVHQIPDKSGNTPTQLCQNQAILEILNAADNRPT